MTTQLAGNLEYVELLLDSNRQSVAQNSDYPAIQWPRFEFKNLTLYPAAIKIVSAEVPFTFWRVNERNNRILLTDQAGTSTTELFVTPGNYTAVEIAAELTALLNTAGYGTFSVTYNTKNYHLEFDNTLGYTIFFGQTLGVGETALYPLLGTPQTWTFATGPNSFVDTSTCRISGGTTLNLCSQTLGFQVKCLLPSDAQVNSPNNQICRIQLDCQPGGVAFYKDPNPEKYFDYISTTNLEAFDLFFIDGTNTDPYPVDFNNTPFSVKIGLLCYKQAGSNLSNAGASQIFRKY